MAVEKMELMNLVAHQDNLELILRKIVAMENVHVIDAMTEIDESNFTLNMLEENMEEIVNMCMIKPYKTDKSFRKIQEELEELMALMDIPTEVQMEHFEAPYDYSDVEVEIDSIFQRFKSINERKSSLEAELERLKAFEIVRLLEGVDIDLESVYSMSHFTMKLGTLTKENRNKFTRNYENVTAAAMHIGVFEDEEAYLVVSPKDLDMETDRILRSVYFREVEVVPDLLGPVAQMVSALDRRMRDIEDSIDDLNGTIRESKEKYAQSIACCYSRTAMEESVTVLKPKIACTKSFFYLSGWVSVNDKESVSKEIESVGLGLIVGFKSLEETSRTLTPPTKLKNPKVFRPFELLVEMYGTPSYSELDPTLFLALTYMLLFGAMFGDIGQGLVLYLAGLFIARRKAVPLYGGILSRLGISSMIFGVLYDSVFGYEHVLSGLLVRLSGRSELADIFIRPIENINAILMSSIVLGLGLLLISFIYSIFNKLSIRDYREGLFGRNGIAGLILFVALLAYAFTKFTQSGSGWTAGLVPIIVAAVAVIIFREPLANIVLGHRPLHHEALGEYYVESGFDILETFLSLLSNSISFIRVGAFALNHVGLFIAFHTMASIIGTLAGDITMFLVGNVIVIFLEGLIVFIQGLRLVYYELFSKYYTGEGIPFEPAGVRASR